MRRSSRIAVGVGLGVALLAWWVPAAIGDPPSADLRADVNRDGRVDVTGATDERGEDQAGITSGAVFLPNVDDDQRRCKITGPDGKPLPDAEIIACGDGADTVVNGVQDEKDLARLRSVPLASLPDGAEGKASVTGPGARHTHLFLNRGGRWQLLRPTDKLAKSDLERGLELGIEGTDIVRDAKVWDGRATVTLSVTAGDKTTTDTVELRAAPLLTHHHLQRAQQIMVTRMSKKQAEEMGEPGLDKASARFIADLKKAVAAAGLPKPPFEFITNGDLFPQDSFEPMYTSMPGAAGKPQTMRVLFRAHQQQDSSIEFYERLRGPDVGIASLAPDDYDAGLGDTLDSMGNLETIPPYSHNGRSYPAGRVIMGRGNKPKEGGPGPGGPGPSGAKSKGTPPSTTKTSRTQSGAQDEMMDPSPAVQRFLASQGLQDPLLLDSSWTVVQHVDEFIQFLPAATPRGWRVAVADPEAGMKLLRDAQAAGHGKLPLHSRGKPDPGARLKTIDDHLRDKDQILARDNTRAAKYIAEDLALIKRETGVQDNEIVRVPSLFGSADLHWGDQGGEGGYVSPLFALIPAAINGVVLGPDRYLSTKQFGTVIDQKDIFADAVSAAYGSAGMKVDFIDGLLFHDGGGEIHCGTNMLRDATKPWWRAPR